MGINIGHGNGKFCSSIFHVEGSFRYVTNFECCFQFTNDRIFTLTNFYRGMIYTNSVISIFIIKKKKEMK